MKLEKILPELTEKYCNHVDNLFDELPDDEKGLLLETNHYFKHETRAKEFILLLNDIKP